MAHFLVSDERYRRMIYEDNPQSSQAERPLRAGYRFGRVPCKPAHRAPRRIQDSFRRVIEAIVDSKLRRMERELELSGIPTRDLR
jgi:hypothetical protein